MRLMFQRLLPACAVLVAALIFTTSGCDKGIRKITVKGSVTYDGKPVSSGLLRFIGPEGAYSAAMLNTDGTYIMTDVLPGETKVGVMESPQGSGSSSGGKSAPTVTPASLPEKFRDPEKSGVKYMITPETKELNVELK